MRPNYLGPVPSPTGQRGTDVKSVDTIVDGMPVLPILPFTPFLLNNNRLLPGQQQWVQEGIHAGRRQTGRARANLRECQLPSLLVFHSVPHSLRSCYLLGIVMGPVEETGGSSSVIGFGYKRQWHDSW